MFEQDRPIKPDANYLKQWQEKQKQQKKASKAYLNKSNKELLPCQRNRKSEKSASPKRSVSKAEIYEKIKKKNREKFGQWQKHQKKQNKQQNNIQEKKKLKPNQMTISYQPKSVRINTIQYKKPGYVPAQPKISEDQQNQMQYKKMVEYMKRMYTELEKQKQSFEKQKEYLKFKKTIQNYDGIEIKPKVNTNLQKQRTNETKIIKNPQKVVSNIEPLQQEKANIVKQGGMRNNKSNRQLPRQHSEQSSPRASNFIQPFHYTVDRLNQCNPFSIRQIHKYLKLDDLIPENNKFYAQVKKILQNQRSTAKVQTIKQKCTHGSIGANHSTCGKGECAEKRITKFENGWYEMWVAGQYRTVYNKDTGLKMVWYNNGDVKQEFSKQKIELYESAGKKVVQVKVGNHQPFWYFYYKDQLEMKDKNGNRQVIFGDGRHEIIVDQKNE